MTETTESDFHKYVTSLRNPTLELIPGGMRYSVDGLTVAEKVTDKVLKRTKFKVLSLDMDANWQAFKGAQ